MIDPRTTAWLDQADAGLVAMIRKHRFAVQYVGGGEGCPPFAYTIGLFGLGHPELVVLALPPRSAHALLSDLAARIIAGDNLLPGTETTTLAGPALVEELPNPGGVAFGANRFYARPSIASVPVLQLTLDQAGPRPGEWSA